MQYRNYEIQNAEFGFIIRNSKDEFITYVENDYEAEEFIDNLYKIEADMNLHNKIKQDLYKSFCKYCRNLPGKCYIDEKLATTNISVLNSFIRSFENNVNVNISYSVKLIDGERFYLVDSVSKR